MARWDGWSAKEIEPAFDQEMRRRWPGEMPAAVRDMLWSIYYDGYQTGFKRGKFTGSEERRAYLESALKPADDPEPPKP